jgi:ACT domain-containing protein
MKYARTVYGIVVRVNKSEDFLVEYLSNELGTVVKIIHNKNSSVINTITFEYDENKKIKQINQQSESGIVITEDEDSFKFRKDNTQVLSIDKYGNIITYIIWN